MNKAPAGRPRDLSAEVWDIFACSSCGGRLRGVQDGLTCDGCESEFRESPTGAIDFRLRKPNQYFLPITLGAPLVPSGLSFGQLEPTPTSEVNFGDMELPWHLTRALRSYLPRARTSRSLMLDLGCGSGLHRELGERAGFQWVGLDYDGPDAPILGDAHGLPFVDQSFELMISLAVLEHAQYPLVVTRELMHGLKPGGLLVGTVAFLEPFRGTSYYHQTHLRTFNSLHSSGLDVLTVGPNRDCSVRRAHVRMGSGLFPKILRVLGNMLNGPLEAMHKLWWWAGGLVTPKSNFGESAARRNRYLRVRRAAATMISHTGSGYRFSSICESAS